MNSAKIVMHVVKGDRCFQVLNFLRESICQPSEAAHRHAHCEVLAHRALVTGIEVMAKRTEKRTRCEGKENFASVMGYSVVGIDGSVEF